MTVRTPSSDATTSLGQQGGDTRGVDPSALDLSSCVNRYGPHPEAARTLHALSEQVLVGHPYEAEEQLRGTYASYLGTTPDELVSSRGASGLIWALARGALRGRVVVPLPGYTEYVQAFPEQLRVDPREGAGHRPEFLGELLAQGKAVLFSNPHNPSGQRIRTRVLERLALDNPEGILVADESYIEFSQERDSLIGTQAENVVVLRSPSKFFGIAGVRVGVAWSRNPCLRDALRGHPGSWALSQIEVSIGAAVLSAPDDWSRKVRAHLHEDRSWLEQRFAEGGEADGFRTPKPPTANFVFVTHPDAERLARELRSYGVIVRFLGTGHGLPVPGLRITAPTPAERPRLADALAAVGVRQGQAL